MGYTDWDTVLKGTATAAGGIFGALLGAAAILSPTLGLGQVGGAAGWGVGMVIAGFKDNGRAGKYRGGNRSKRNGCG